MRLRPVAALMRRIANAATDGRAQYGKVQGMTFLNFADFPVLSTPFLHQCSNRTLAVWIHGNPASHLCICWSGVGHSDKKAYQTIWQFIHLRDVQITYWKHLKTCCVCSAFECFCAVCKSCRFGGFELILILMFIRCLSAQSQI